MTRTRAAWLLLAVTSLCSFGALSTFAPPENVPLRLTCGAVGLGAGAGAIWLLLVLPPDGARSVGRSFLRGAFLWGSAAAAGAAAYACLDHLSNPASSLHSGGPVVLGGILAGTGALVGGVLGSVLHALAATMRSPADDRGGF